LHIQDNFPLILQFVATHVRKIEPIFEVGARPTLEQTLDLLPLNHSIRHRSYRAVREQRRDVLHPREERDGPRGGGREDVTGIFHLGAVRAATNACA
jgi:hypothetical protein